MYGTHPTQNYVSWHAIIKGRQIIKQYLLEEVSSAYTTGNIVHANVLKVTYDDFDKSHQR